MRHFRWGNCGCCNDNNNNNEGDLSGDDDDEVEVVLRSVDDFFRWVYWWFHFNPRRADAAPEQGLITSPNHR